MSNYYVSGCIDVNGDVSRCDDSAAQFWTLYHRNDDGLSEGIIDCVFREDAEAAMRVYEHRDALAASFDELAKAVGWSVEQCEQTGESPMDVAVSLVNLVAELENDAYPTTDEWAIDKTCDRPILVYKGCSVIEAGDAAYILNLVKQDRTAIRDASHEV